MRLYFGPLLRLGRFQTVASSEADRALLLRDAPYLANVSATFLNAMPLKPLLGLGRSPVPGRVVAIGRIVPNKALPDLVKALSRIGDLDWSLVVAGEPDPDELARLEAQVDVLKVGDRVRYALGFPAEELPRLLSSAAMAAFPSKGEGFGLALLEAMAAGVPLLARRIPAHEQLLRGALEAQLVDFDEPEAAAGSIRALLRARKGDLDQLSARLRAEALNYDIDRLRGQIDELYARMRVRPHSM